MLDKKTIEIICSFSIIILVLGVNIDLKKLISLKKFKDMNNLTNPRIN